MDPDVGDRTLAAMSVGGEPTPGLVEVLVTELPGGGTCSWWCWTTFTWSRGPRLLHALVYLASHLPSHVHLIVTTRQPGGLGMHRLRMSGDLVEMDQEELRFLVPTRPAAFSQSVATQSIPSDQVEILTARTEGWAAGLRLAGKDPGRSKGWSISRRPPVRRRLPSLVAEYFEREVLDDLPPDTIRFMMETSVLEAMNSRNCVKRSLTAPMRAPLLQDLADRRLFTLRMNGKSRRYRVPPSLRRIPPPSRLAVQDADRARHAHLLGGLLDASKTGTTGLPFDHLVQGQAYDQALALGAADLRTAA